MAASREIIIVAGPNGAGKTTFARSFLPAEGELPRFINADLIVSGLRNFHHFYKLAVDDWVLYDNSGVSPVILEWGQQP